jgi:GTPase SAR1 family protein
MQGMCNILLLGDTRVGKSALLRRLMDDQFDEDYTPTIMTNLVPPLPSSATRPSSWTTSTSLCR